MGETLDTLVERVMTKRFQLKKYIRTLSEIDDIMSAMKNLSFIEINKLTKYIKTQTNVVNTIADVGSDFLTFSAHLLPAFQTHQPDVYILIGSERGFCGDFNDNIITQWKRDLGNQLIQNKKIIVVGRKLAGKLIDEIEVLEVIDGPNVAEEIPEVILMLLNALKNIKTEIAKKYMPGNWNIIFNELEETQVLVKTVNPLKKVIEERKISFGYKAIMNISEQEFLAEYLEHYLFANLYQIFYQSLMSENDKRLRHIDNAKSKLEKKRIKLTHKINILRQEEITEEIENILLSVESVIIDPTTNSSNS